MSTGRTQDAWTERYGALRGSSLMRIGAVAIFLAACLNFCSQFMIMELGRADLVTPAWVGWILGLWVLAGGFVWVGVEPILSRLGLLVGLFFFLNGLMLMLTLFLGIAPFVPPNSLTIGRTLLLLVFAVRERNIIGERTTLALVASSLLLLAKTLVRLAELVPPAGFPVDPAVDALLVVFLAVALFMLGNAVRRGENRWARESPTRATLDFADFNNPDHDRRSE